MPLQKYKCDDCGYCGEVMVPLSRHGEVLECPKCGGEYRQQMSAPRFIIY